MTRSIDESTELIDRYLHDLNVPAWRRLRPGISTDEVQRRLFPRGLQADSNVLSLYRWHDGTSWDGDPALNDLHLVPGFYFPTIDESLAIYDQFVNELDENPAWFPIMADGGSGYSFVDLSHLGQQPIYHFTFEDIEHEKQYDSVRHMLDTIAESYLKGIFFVGEDGWLDNQWEAHWALARQMNPTASYWIDD
ncbi:hypothetical protein IG195_08965 [Arthrobacter sp. TES]|uniref:hypothetical protein n=1 Tax=Paenarthrobacter TaxID=1742992 RepID=UPI000AAE03CE|nr:MULTISPECIES: hypothetical protein [Paenarthrobacter]QOI65141.1 hypothetical protein IG195_08965 [Arthrobacter sp. TES]BCW86099.1 hypothetical protein NicSoilE8_37720 [Arthrobacter sp. NicSoilE8]WOC60883.1 hypothetical protein RI444_20695 [Paenarthrobacter sp. AT5]GLU60582.1 hypothetical protein Pure01_30950 [Paenarthrobacter ureafaciens]GLU64689.1 hypothetical protein Pure02_29390 [Paenarthrobacter ureafaciens]